MPREAAGRPVRASVSVWRRPWSSLWSFGDVCRLAITAFKDGNAPALATEADLDLSALDEALKRLLSIPPPKDEVTAKYKQPRGFFSPDGRRLELLSEMANRVVFLFEGGQFIWPGVKVGHKSACVWSATS